MHPLIRVLSSKLSPAFIGSDFLTTTEPSATCSTIGLAFPIEGYTSPTYQCLPIGVYSASPSNCTFCSIHPDPNHVDTSYRSFPSKDLPIRYAIRIGFPVFWAGHPISPPPLVHTLFRAGLCLQTFQILLHRRHPVHPSFWERMLLRLRYLKGKS